MNQILIFGHRLDLISSRKLHAAIKIYFTKASHNYEAKEAF